MTWRFRRPGAAKRPVPAALAIVGAVLAGLIVAAGPSASAAPQRLAATGGCRAVGSGDAPSGGGPNRATVVVDTGSGAVWSACISFSGTISGVEALERAQDVITDLDPVYDQYAGLGKAVCKLRGIGTAPPDCLGKSVNYWSLSLNGKVAPVGAGAISLKDGDVEGWRYGTGGMPRKATEGTEAAAAPPVTTTRPPTPTTQPSRGTTVPGGGLVGSTAPDGTPLATTSTRPGATTSTTKPGETTTSQGQTTTTTKDSADEPGEAASVEGASEDDGPGDGEAAAGASTGSSGDVSSASGSSEGSSVPAAAGFVAVLAAVGLGAVFVRRRRLAVPSSTPSA